MGEPTHKASDPNRRASLRTSRGVSLTQNGPPVLDMDLDDEDYALMALGVVVSDGGYRPGPDPTYAPPSMHTPAPAIPSASTSTHNDRSVTPEPVSPVSPISRPVSPEFMSPGAATSPHIATAASPAPLNRSSISKPPRGRDSLTLRHDGSVGHVAASIPETPSSSLARASTVSSISTASSAAAYLVSDGPYRGPSAPSHSYSFYPQDTRQARSMSVATDSTAPTTRPESEYNGPTGPSHPYSMYPQMPLEESIPEPVVPAIPLGFTTAPDLYQRRLGPEGEELAPIIGPDGHTEELPPYTRYPDEHYARKIRGENDTERPGEGAGAVAAAVAAAAGPVTTMPAISHRHSSSLPPGAGGIGLAARNPEFDARSVEDGGSPGSRHSTRSFASDSHHEINTAAAAVSEKPQLGKWQKLAKKKACGVVPYWALGLTCTAVLIVLIIIAAVVGTLLSHRANRPPKASPTNYQDSVPTVTVTFDATPIPTPANLPALAQGKFGLPLNLNSNPNTCFNNTAQTAAWSCNIAFNQAVAMQLQVNQNAPQLGKDGTYDVLLITDHSNNPDPNDDDQNLMYGASAPVIKPAMNMELVNDTFDLERGPAWFRMLPYNKTVIVPDSLFSASTSSENRRGDPSFAPSVGGGGGGGGGGNFQRKGVVNPGDKPWICVWPDTFVEIFIYAQQNSSYASQSTATITTAPLLPAVSTGTGATAQATATGGTEVISMNRMSAYPKAVKIKERRINKSPRAYCYQVEVKSDNSTEPITDSNGNVVTVEIDEIEQSNGMDKREGGEDGDMSDCGCMWFSS